VGLGTVTCGRQGLVRSNSQERVTFGKAGMRTVFVTSAVTTTVVVDTSVVKTVAGGSLCKLIISIASRDNELCKLT
jgi:hypothetical protein